MRYNDIITERELKEGPLDWIKQKAGQAADWAADKLGYQPKQAPATKVNKAAAQDFDFDDPKYRPQVKPLDMTGVKTGSNADDFDFDANLRNQPQVKPLDMTGVKTSTNDQARRLNKAIDNDFQMRRDAMAAGSTNRKDIQAYRQKQAKANKQAINKMAKDPNSQWNQKINVDDL